MTLLAPLRWAFFLWPPLFRGVLGGRSHHLTPLQRVEGLLAATIGDLEGHAGDRQLIEDSVCPAARLALPALAAVAALALTICVLRRHVRQSDELEAARTCVLLPQFLLMMGASIIVLDSYALAEAAQFSPGASGQLIGLNWLGAAIGFVTMWAALKYRPQLWRHQPRAICVIGLTLNSLGVLLYLVCAQAIQRGTAVALASVTVKGARFFGGIGQGLVAQLMVVTVQSLTSTADMSVVMTRVFFVNTVSIGSGPVIAAFAHLLTLCPLQQSSFAAAPTVQLIANLGGLLGVVLLFPDVASVSLPDKPSERPSNTAAVAGQEEDEDVTDRRRRRWLIFSCTAIFLLRSLVTSGVEVGSALLLERDFGMDRRVVGFAVGATFFAAFPMRLFHEQLRERGLTLQGRFRLFSGMAAFGTLLLLRPVGVILPWGIAVLLADSIIFPCAFLADGLSYGELMKNVFPEGSLLDKNHSALWCNLLAFGAGRLGGPWMARWHLEALGRTGQDRYALWQMLACITTIAIFESGVRPAIKT